MPKEYDPQQFLGQVSELNFSDLFVKDSKSTAAVIPDGQLSLEMKEENISEIFGLVNNRLAVVSTSDGKYKTRIWNLVSGKCEHTIESTVRFLSKEALLTDGADGKFSIWFFDGKVREVSLISASYKPLKPDPGAPYPGTYDICAAGLSSNRILAVAFIEHRQYPYTNVYLEVWDLKKQAHIKTTRHNELKNLSFLPDGSFIFIDTLLYHRILKADGTEISQKRCPIFDLPRHCKHLKPLSNNQIIFVESDEVEKRAANRNRVYDVVKEKYVADYRFDFIPRAGRSMITPLANGCIADVSVKTRGPLRDKNVVIYTLPSGRIVHTIDCHEEGVAGLAELDNGRLATAGIQDSTIQIWSFARRLQLSDIAPSLQNLPQKAAIISINLQGVILTNEDVKLLVKLLQPYRGLKSLDLRNTESLSELGLIELYENLSFITLIQHEQMQAVYAAMSHQRNVVHQQKQQPQSAVSMVLMSEQLKTQSAMLLMLWRQKDARSDAENIIFTQLSKQLASQQKQLDDLLMQQDEVEGEGVSDAIQEQTSAVVGQDFIMVDADAQPDSVVTLPPATSHGKEHKTEPDATMPAARRVGKRNSSRRPSGGSSSLFATSATDSPQGGGAAADVDSNTATKRVCHHPQQTFGPRS